MKNIFTNKLKGIIIVVLERIRDFIFYGLLLGFTVILIESGNFTFIDILKMFILFICTLIIDIIVKLYKKEV